MILSALAVGALLAGACGSSEDEGSSAKKTSRKAEEPTAVETVQVAYEETAAERTAKTSFEVTTTGPEGDGQGAEPATFTMRGRGVMDFSGAEASMTMNMLGLGNLEMRQVGGTIYMKMPEDFPAQAPDPG